MVFWTICVALTLAIGAILVLALRRGGSDHDSPAAYDLRVYRDQLKEVERDLARGVINDAEADRIRAEVSRRILAADQAIKDGTSTGEAPESAAIVAGAAVVLFLLGGGLWMYSSLGAPGAGDLSLKTRIAQAKETRETRPSQQDAEASLPPDPTRTPPAPEYLELMTKLRAAVAERPSDLPGHELLARNEAQLGNFTAAYQAQQKILGIKGDDATAADYVSLGELMILAAGGYVSPEAENALRGALAREPGNGAARYYMGLMMIQTGRPDVAFRTWNNLLKEGPADAPWTAPIRAQIEDVAARAGVKYTLPPPQQSAPPMLSGPTAEDMENAADMSPEERQEMIQGMVSQLMDRLANEGGTAQEWARLIGALGVMGDTERAAAIWGEAQQVFDGRPQMLDIVRDGARRAGLVE